jgi:hypothetical protein
MSSDNVTTTADAVQSAVVVVETPLSHSALIAKHVSDTRLREILGELAARSVKPMSSEELVTAALNWAHIPSAYHSALDAGIRGDIVKRYTESLGEGALTATLPSESPYVSHLGLVKGVQEVVAEMSAMLLELNLLVGSDVHSASIFGMKHRAEPAKASTTVKADAAPKADAPKADSPHQDYARVKAASVVNLEGEPVIRYTYKGQSILGRWVNGVKVEQIDKNLAPVKNKNGEPVVVESLAAFIKLLNVGSINARKHVEYCPTRGTDISPAEWESIGN